MNDIDKIQFHEESIETESSASNSEPWKIITVDDEKDVHQITELVLNDFTFNGKGIKFFSAYSANEAKTIIEKNPDIALMFLDVVMETDDAGLQLVKHVREKLNNSLIRIILRTGQPGLAPEKEIIRDYDINDYKEKSEMSEHKLFTYVISSLRSYQNIKQLDEIRNNLEKTVQERTSELVETNKNLELEIEERKHLEKAREKLILNLQKALTEVKTLSGFIPICAACKNIRNDEGYWDSVEKYIEGRSNAEFTHGICPGCRDKLYPELS